MHPDRKQPLQRTKQKQSGRRSTPAGRNICFAQLRAEMSEKDAREARRSPEIMKILILGTP